MTGPSIVLADGAPVASAVFSSTQGIYTWMGDRVIGATTYFGEAVTTTYLWSPGSLGTGISFAQDPTLDPGIVMDTFPGNFSSGSIVRAGNRIALFDGAGNVYVAVFDDEGAFASSSVEPEPATLLIDLFVDSDARPEFQGRLLGGSGEGTQLVRMDATELTTLVDLSAEVPLPYLAPAYNGVITTAHPGVG